MKLALAPPPSLRRLAPWAASALLAGLAGACGGGGGGLDALPGGAADIVIVNSSMMNTSMTPGNGNCTDGAPNVYEIDGVVVTSTTTARSRSYTFPSPIPVGGSASILGGVPAGDTYSVKVTYAFAGPLVHETDQCPLDGFLALAGVTTVTMQY